MDLAWRGDSLRDHVFVMLTMLTNGRIVFWQAADSPAPIERRGIENDE
jgi:hypothetical protein